MLLSAYRLILKPRSQYSRPDWLGRAAQAWLLGWVRERDAALAALLHGGQEGSARRAYTIAPPLPLAAAPGFYALRLTSLNSALSTLLSVGLAAVRVVTLANTPFDAVRCELEACAELETLAADIFTNFTKPAEGPASRQALPSLRFTTPTAFRSHGLSVPLPLPSLIFANLVQAWAALSSAPLPAQVGPVVQAHVGVAYARITTRQIKLAAQETRIGFVGSVRFHVALSAEEEDQLALQTLRLLVALAPFAGVGVRTTVGMGQVQLSEPHL
jgi:hypothetical protein